jgi:hypothetical protein
MQFSSFPVTFISSTYCYKFLVRNVLLSQYFIFLSPNVLALFYYPPTNNIFLNTSCYKPNAPECRYLKKSAIIQILGKLRNETVNFLLNANMKLELRLAL